MEPGEINYDDNNELLEKEILGAVQGAPEPEAGADIFAPATPNPEYKKPGQVEDKSANPETMDFGKINTIDDDIPRIKKWTKTESTHSIEMFLNVRSTLQAELLAKIADTNDKSKYEYTEDQMNDLARVYMPYAEKYGGKIPDWVWLIMIESITTGKMVLAAFNEGKINRANKKALKNPVLKAEMKRAVKKAADVESTTERRNFEIDDEGFYKKDLKNVYVKQSLRNEKASLNDLKGLLEYNSIAHLKYVFPAFDFEPHEKFPNE